MITIVDYGAGNLYSVANSLAAIGAEFRFARDREALAASERILLPGVGHFGAMMSSLVRSGLKDGLISAYEAGTPILGICLGMQAMFEASEEAPDVPGLGLLHGSVQAFSKEHPVPHMGWNTVEFNDGRSDWFYFANSFAVPICGSTIATTDHFGRFSSAVRQGRLLGFQFHPEKSGPHGLELLSLWCNDAL